MEPLRSLLEFSEDKHADLMKYLPSKTIHKLQNHEYRESEDIYLNESVVCVSRETGLVGNYGKVVKVTDDTITVKQGYRNLYVPLKEIYLFKKLRKTKKNDRDFYEALLNIL
tara:strand:- start:149 stop:484 length:336 start_codon:yes stop_codon:yes gene_type:complete